MEHFGTVFMLDLREETRTQLQEETIASSCLTPEMEPGLRVTGQCVFDPVLSFNTRVYRGAVSTE